MLLINDCFQTHVFDHRLQGFLLMLKRKAVHAKLTGKGCRTAVSSGGRSSETKRNEPVRKMLPLHG